MSAQPVRLTLLGSWFSQMPVGTLDTGHDNVNDPGINGAPTPNPGPRQIEGHDRRMNILPPLEETWVVIPGYAGMYEVSDMGRVRSRHKGGEWRVLKPRPNRKGYPHVSLCIDGRQDGLQMHNLVAPAFLGPRPEGMVTRHINGNPLDNRAVNLAYGTLSENARDVVEHGRHPYAKRTHCFQGHPYSPENTIIRSEGGRRCRTCKNAREAARKRRARQARALEVAA